MINEIHITPQEAAWLPWAVQYFFFMGIAATSVLLAVVVRWKSKSKSYRTELTLMALALASGIAGPAALSADLHQPARVVNFYLHFTPTSWMSLGAFAVPLFTGLVVLYFLLLVRENSAKESTYKWLQFIHWGKLNSTLWASIASIVLSALALFILFYMGKEVSTIKAQPLWHTPWLAWVMFFSALQVGPIIAKTWFRCAKIDESTQFLTFVQITALLGTLLCFIGWGLGDTPAAEALKGIVQSDGSWRVIVSLIGVSWILMASSALTELFSKKELRLPLLLILSCIALVMAWVIRWGLLMQAQSIPKFNITANPYELPLGADGLLSIIGCFGLWIALLVIVWSLLQGRWLKIGRSA